MPTFEEEVAMLFTTDDIAAELHETFERLAPRFSDKTRYHSTIPWDQAPDEYKLLLRAVIEELLDRNVIQAR